MNLRSSGILLHLTSLPSEFGIGDMGPGALNFAAFLARSRQRCWQILPLNPTETAHGHSPYHSISAFAGNPLLISPRWLMQDGLVDRGDLAAVPKFNPHRVDFAAVQKYKQRLFAIAHAQFSARRPCEAYVRFCRETPWLEDFVLFKILQAHFKNRSWTRWPPALRDRHPSALSAARRQFAEALGFERFLQFLFFRQWRRLKTECFEKGIQMIGDIPIYVPLESADVWARPRNFKLGKDKRPLAVSGVPPDYFSRTGQLWGHPVYDWDRMTADGYQWWIDRLAHHLTLFDRVRLDHFRGLVAYWQVPAGAKTAIRGSWVPAPAADFLRRALKRLPGLRLIAEDLGVITPDVRETMRAFDLPGMRVLQFAFGDDFPEGAFLPHNFIPHCVAYTGTHDNNTIGGWFKSEAGARHRRNLFRYLGEAVPAAELHWHMIRLLMMSVADTVIIPLQDLLGLDETGRMNRPARRRGNWCWRFESGDLTARMAGRLREFTVTYGRD